MSYEYIIAGLEELALGESAGMSESALLSHLEEHLGASDLRLLAQVRRTRDDASISSLLEDDAVRDRMDSLSLSEDDFRTQLLYEQGMKSRNRFVREWFAFNLNLNNVLAAVVCQKHGLDVEKVVVGENDVAELLRRGGVQKNANLAAVLPELKEIIAVAGISDLLDRERHIDALRWEWLDEHARFHYFDIEAVLAYYLKSTILHRWDTLTQEEGERIFRELVADMKKGIDKV